MAILVIALLAAVAFVVLRRRGHRPAGARFGRRTRSPIGRPGVAARSHPMAEVVADHAQATDPQEVVAAEQRMRSRAQQVAAGLQAGNETMPEGYDGRAFDGRGAEDWSGERGDSR